jgi:thiamine-phosphate pyrophosphorylase
MTRPTSNPRKPLAGSLYAIIDLEVADSPLELAERTLAVQPAWIQLRAKGCDDRTWIEIASALRERCTEARTPFVINDRADIATIVEADGLHLGQADLSIEDARRVVGEMTIGISTHDLEQAIEAERRGADLVAFGPVFDTSTKRNPDPTVGLEALAEVCKAVQAPVVAIGGIRPESAERVLDAGAAYLAVISGLPRFIATLEAQRSSSKY